MKRRLGVVKGTPSGLLISFGVHAGVIAVAGLIIVATIKDKPIPFAPPEVPERTVMDLQKLQPRVTKTTRPQSPTPISVPVADAQMPQLLVPDLPGSGRGEGLGAPSLGIGDITLAEPINPFGVPKSIGNDLEGVLYDFKRFRNGSKNNSYDLQTYVEKFIRSGWKTSSISQFYRSPNKLYSPTIMIPPTESQLGPWAFGEPDMDPWAYMLHYKGLLIHKEKIKFRFVAMADNYLVIRVNGNVVLDYKNQFEAAIPGKPFQPLNYHLGHWYAYASDWIELEAGVPQNVEMIMGEYSGVLFASMIAVQVYGEDYSGAPLPMDNPQLPIFKTAELTKDQVDTIYEGLWEGHLMITNGPVFCDLGPGVKSDKSTSDALGGRSVPELEKPKQVASAARVWSLKSGKNLEAEFVKIFSDKVVLKTLRGDVVKIPLTDFSDADLEQVELLNPPELKLSFKKNSKQFEVRSNPEMIATVPVATDFSGGVVVQQQDLKNSYSRPLRLEFYVVADEYDGDHFILHDRQVESFSLTPENEHRFELTGRSDIMMRYEHYSGKVRGEKFKGYMILIFNEQDELIAQNLSHDWLLDIRNELLDFPVGRHFNKEGKRVAPPRPLFTDKYWDHEA